MLGAFKLPTCAQCLKVLNLSSQNHFSDFYFDTIICDKDTCIIPFYSDSLLKLLEAVISKLSIQIIRTSDSISVLIIFKKDKSYKRYLLAQKNFIKETTCLSKCPDCY